MQHSVLSCLLLLVAGVLAQAEALTVQRTPLVVHDGQSTISATRYYQRLRSDEAAGRAMVMPADASSTSITNLAMETRLPLASARLTVGQPTLHTQQGQITPLFIMGMDAVSLAWFEQAAADLADINARGVVVQADRPVEWQRLQQHAADLGIELMLLDGDSLADGYGISTYPVVIVSPQRAAALSNQR